MHRRVPGRKAGTARVFGQVVEAQRLRLGDHHPKDAAAVGRLADRGVRRGIDPVGHESLEPRAARVDHPERGVPGAGQVGRGLDEPLQEPLERELRGDRHARVEHGAEPAFTFGGSGQAISRRVVSPPASP